MVYIVGMFGRVWFGFEEMICFCIGKGDSPAVAGPVSIEAIDKANPFYLDPVQYNHDPGCPVWLKMVKVAAIVSTNVSKSL